MSITGKSIRKTKATLFALLAASVLTCGSPLAADIDVVSAVPVQGVLEWVRPEFERSTGHRLNTKFGTAAVLKRQLDSGESFDIAILTPPMNDDLAKQGEVVGQSAATVAKTGIGVAVKAGAPKPSIDTRDALGRTLLASSAIAYTKEGQSGVATARMMDALGIAEEMKPKTHLDARPAGGLLAAAEGKVVMAFALLSEIAVNGDVDLVGPPPDDLQTYVVFTAGASPSCKEPEACKAFIAFLRTPTALVELRKLGIRGE